jgi:hypothetical protein
MPRRSQSPISRKHSTVASMPQNLPQTVVPMSPRPTMFQTMKEGLAFGVGNAIAHRMIMGNALQQQRQEQRPEKQEVPISPEYIQCIKEYNDKAVCEEMYLKK